MKFSKKRGNARSRRKSRVWRARFHKSLFWTGVLAAVAALGFVGYHNDFFKKTEARIITEILTRTAGAGFKVKEILVTGREQVPVDELLACLNIREDMPIFGINIIEARKSLVVLPWVRDVSISRRLPDTIIVELKERVPVALWQYQKEISVIDRNGIFLTSDNLNIWKRLPLVVGEDAPEHMNELFALLNVEPEISNVLVSAVRMGGRRWDLHLKNGISVKLPEQDQALALRRLALLVEQGNILNRNIKRIDMRQSEKIVVMPMAANKGALKNKKTST